MEITLYTTLGCHLCEQVEHMLAHLSERFPHALSLVDIADDDALLDAYGTSIPVLYRPDINMEFAWPFDVEQLGQFLALVD